MRGVLRAIIVAASPWRCKGGRAGLGRWHGAEPVDGRGCAIEAQHIRVDRAPGLGPVDAGPRLAGIKGRRRRSPQSLARTTSIPYWMNRTWFFIPVTITL